MLVWFKLTDLQQKVGMVTDVLAEYVEVWCEENKEYYIRPFDECTVIK